MHGLSPHFSIRWLLVAAGLLFFPPGARAVYNHYTDRAAFLTATGAISATGALPDAGVLASPQTVGGVTITRASGATQLHIGGAGQETARIAGPEISVVGSTNLNFTFAAPVHGVGFEIVEPQNDPLGAGQTFVDSTFGITLKNGTTNVAYFFFNPANDTTAFIGLVSTLPFNTVELREVTGGPDFEFIGEILTSADAAPVTLAVSGEDLPEFAAFDAALRAYLDESCFPGITAAATWDGRLIYRRSYGWTDYTHTTPLHYSTPMGLGSCTKPITTTLLRNLIRGGQLADTDRMVDVLGLTPPPGMEWVPGFSEILIGHLNVHSGGIPRYKPDNDAVGALLGLGRPANFAELISWQGTQPLLFAPGTGTSYSNFGFGILGAVIEKITGDRYEKAVTERLGGPLGAYTIRGPTDEPYLTPTPPGVLPATLYLNNSAAGGMLASAPDYCRYMRAFRMTGVPKATATPGGGFFYTFYGSVDDVFAVARQRQSGGHALEWVVFTNDRGYSSVNYLDDSTEAGIINIPAFPTHDFFPYLNWKLGWYWNPAIGVMHPGAGDTDDADHDGLPVILEYAAGRFPKTADLQPPFVTFSQPVAGGAVEFRRHPLRNDITTELQHSTDLFGWVPIARTQNGTPTVSLDATRWSVSEEPVGVNGELRIRVSELGVPGAKGFFRVRVAP